MKKTFKTMISAVMAVAMLAGSAVIPVSAQDIEIDHSNIKIFKTIDDVKEFYSKIDEHFDEMSEENQNIFAQYMLDTLGKYGFKVDYLNDDESGAVTILWNGMGVIFLGSDYDDGFIKYVIHNGEAYISRFNFQNDPNITEYAIPDEINGYPVVGIGGYAFGAYGKYGEGNNIKKIIIPNTVRRIGCEAFYFMDKLESIELSHPDEHSDLQVILSEAFYNCSCLKEVTCFDNSDLKFIGISAFRDCTSLEKFDFPNNEISIQGNINQSTIFWNTKIKENKNIKIPASFMKQEIKFENEYCSDCPVQQRYEWAFKNVLEQFGIFSYDKDIYDIEFSDYDFIELKNDVNFDGKIDIKDLATVKRHLIGDVELTPIQRIALNEDMKVDVRDVAEISRKIIGLAD